MKLATQTPKTADLLTILALPSSSTPQLFFTINIANAQYFQIFTDEPRPQAV